MTDTNQKLREALRQALTALENVITQVKYDEECAAAIIAARQVLATTEPVMANGLTEAETDATASVMGLATTEPEPEPTGMPEVKPWDHPEPQTMRWSDLEIRWIQSYGKRCWNAGFRHGDFSDENISYLAQIRDAVAEICPGASEDLLMNAIGGPCEVPRYVIDVVQKLKQDAARYRWLRDDTDSDWAICEWSHAPGDEGYYRDARAPHIVDAAIDAAMAQGVK